MNRAEKIQLLSDIRAGRATIEDLEPLPPYILILEESGQFDVTGIPASWGYPKQMDAEQFATFRKKLDAYEAKLANRGKPQLIVIHFPEERTE